jgi:acyl-CoA thioester hydrolase
MRHVYECPLRWADMDSLGHVNNVVYVDYLQEARVDMLAVHPLASGGEQLGEGVVVVHHEVDFLRPLMFRRQPVPIETWVRDVRAAGFTLAYEIADERPGRERIVYARATTVLTPFVFAEERPRRLTADERALLEKFVEDEPGAAARPPAVPAVPAGAGWSYPCRVRWSDVDSYGHVNNVKYFEYFQEARICMIDDLAEPGGAGGAGGYVVAHVSVDYLRPILFRPEPIEVRSAVTRIGTSSYELVAQIGDGDQAFARSRAVVVGFDLPRQASRPLTGTERAGLQRALLPGAET